MGNFREKNNSHPPTPHPSTKSWVLKIFLTSSSNSCTTLHRGLREEQASFPLWSQQSIWINFVADWRINITARQPKTFLHPKKTIQDQFQSWSTHSEQLRAKKLRALGTRMRSGQYLTHAHIYITRTVKKTPVAWLYGKREIQSEPAEKLELILAISINYWT